MWLYNKSQLQRTPSIHDGINYNTECEYRAQGARFIIEAGKTLKLQYKTWATSVVYFHRFYVYHSFKYYPHFVMACSTLLAASKVYETPRKCMDIIHVAMLLIPREHIATFGVYPKEAVTNFEKILLKTLKFDLEVDLPYYFLTYYAKQLRMDPRIMNDVVQKVWTYINDSLCTTLCLQWEPEIIAIALMYGVTKENSIKVYDWKNRTKEHSHWWDSFLEDVEIELLEDIYRQVLHSYTVVSNKNIPATPLFGPWKPVKKNYIFPQTIDMMEEEEEITLPSEKNPSLVFSPDFTNDYSLPDTPNSQIQNDSEPLLIQDEANHPVAQTNFALNLPLMNFNVPPPNYELRPNNMPPSNYMSLPSSAFQSRNPNLMQFRALTQQPQPYFHR